MITPEVLKTFGKIVAANPIPTAIVGGSALGGTVGYLRSGRGYKGGGWIVQHPETGKVVDRLVKNGVRETDKEYAKRVGISKKQTKNEADLTWEMVGGKPFKETIRGAISGAVALGLPTYLSVR